MGRTATGRTAVEDYTRIEMPGGREGGRERGRERERERGGRERERGRETEGEKTDRQTDRQTDRETDRQTDRQPRSVKIYQRVVQCEHSSAQTPLQHTQSHKNQFQRRDTHTPHTDTDARVPAHGLYPAPEERDPADL